MLDLKNETVSLIPSLKRLALSVGVVIFVSACATPLPSGGGQQGPSSPPLPIPPVSGGGSSGSSEPSAPSLPTPPQSGSSSSGSGESGEQSEGSEGEGSEGEGSEGEG